MTPSKSKSKRSSRGGGGSSSTTTNTDTSSGSSKRRGSKKGGSSSGSKAKGENRPATPSMRVYDESGCHNATASRPTLPTTSALTNKFAELEEEEEYDDDDDDEEEYGAAGTGRREKREQQTVQVKPLPKIRLDLMPSPREEDEYRRRTTAASSATSGKEKKKSGSGGSGSGSKRRSSSGRPSRRSSGEAASGDNNIGNATNNAAKSVLNESINSTAVTDHVADAKKGGRVAAATQALMAAWRSTDNTSTDKTNNTDNTDRGGAAAKPGGRNVSNNGAEGGEKGEGEGELDADGFPLRPTRPFHDNTGTSPTGRGDGVAMVDGFGNAFYHDGNAGAISNDDAKFPPSPSPLLAIQQNGGAGGDGGGGGGGERARGGGRHHRRLVSDVAVASASAESTSASSERSPSAAKNMEPKTLDSQKDVHGVSPGYIQVTKTKIERDEFAALSEEEQYNDDCDNDDDEEDEDADTTPVAAPDVDDSTEKVFMSIKDYSREKADAVSIDDRNGISPRISQRGSVPEESPSKSSRRREKDQYASPRSPEHRQDSRRRRSSKARREKEERTDHTDSSFSPFDWLLMICGDVSSFVSEGVGGHDDEVRTHDDASSIDADEYHGEKQGGSSRRRKEYGIDKFKW